MADEVKRNLTVNLRVEVDPRAADEAKRLGETIDDVGGKSEEAAKKTQESMDKLSGEYSAAQERIEAGQKEVGNATKTLLDGSLAVTEGFVTMGLLSEDSLEKVVKGLVKIRSTFNIIKGGIDIFFSLREMTAGLTKITQGQVAANQALAASQLLVQKTGAGGLAAGAAGRAEPLLRGAGSAATTAVGGAGGAALASGGGAAGGGGLAAAAGTVGSIAAFLGIAAAKALVFNEAISAVRRMFGDTSDSAESFLGALISWRKASDEATKAQERAEKMEEERTKRLENQASLNEQIAKQGSFDATVRGSRADIQSRRRAAELSRDPGGADVSEDAIVEADRLAALAELDQAYAAFESQRERALERQKAGEFALIEDSIVAADRLASAAEDRANAEQRAYEASQRRLDSQKSLVAESENELKASQDALEAERDRLNTSLERFAELGRGEKAKVKEISDRVSRGEEINRADADLLRKAGLGEKVAGDYFQKEAVATGGLQALEGLGETDDFKKANEKVFQVQQELAARQARLAELASKEADAKQRYIDSLNDLSAANEEQLRVQAEQQGVELRGANGQGAGDGLAAAFEQIDNQMRRQIERSAANQGSLA